MTLWGILTQLSVSVGEKLRVRDRSRGPRVRRLLSGWEVGEKERQEHLLGRPPEGLEHGEKWRKALTVPLAPLGQASGRLRGVKSRRLAAPGT